MSVQNARASFFVRTPAERLCTRTAGSALCRRSAGGGFELRGHSSSLSFTHSPARSGAWGLFPQLKSNRLADCRHIFSIVTSPSEDDDLGHNNKPHAGDSESPIEAVHVQRLPTDASCTSASQPAVKKHVLPPTPAHLFQQALASECTASMVGKKSVFAFFAHLLNSFMYLFPSRTSSIVTSPSSSDGKDRAAHCLIGRLWGGVLHKAGSERSGRPCLRSRS